MKSVEHYPLQLSKPIYIHFLNREMLRAVNLGLHNVDSDDALRILTITTVEPLFCSFAFIWEASDVQGTVISTIRKLVSNNNLITISNFATVDEFISENQIMYEYDAKRYPMYFDAVPSDLFDVGIGFIKESSTTQVLASELIQWSLKLPSQADDLLSLNEGRILESLRSQMPQIILNKGQYAITLSLFRDKLASSEFQKHKYSIARLLSAIHLKHYIGTIGADIPTGIRGLQYFDRASVLFPIYDVAILNEFLTAVGITPDIRRSEHFLDYCIEIRGSSLHRHFVNVIRHLLTCAYRVACNKHTNISISNRQSLLTEVLREILSKESMIDAGLTTAQDILDNALAHTRILTLKAKRDNHVFAKFSSQWEANMDQSQKKTLLLTATDLETETIKTIAQSQYGLRYDRLPVADHTVYVLGSIGGTEVFVVQSDMGTVAPGAMTLTANDVISYLNPDSVILLGIAFGLEKSKQKIGDILVSRQLSLYDHKKLTVKDGQERWYPRGDRPSASVRLLDRFHSGKLDWKGNSVHFGLMLSGNTLSDSVDFVETLKELEPEAIGGEMEGAGVYVVGAKRKVDWIVVKGIADWGYIKNSRYQKRAATNATKFIFHVLSTGGLSV